MSNTTLLDLNSMLDDTLDSVADAPDFVTPPAGEYRLVCKDVAIDTYATKADPDTEKQRLKFTYNILETISLASNNEPPVPDGSIFTENFQATDSGLMYFKKRIKEIMGASDVSGVSLSEMMNSVKGMEFNARTSIKKSKGKDGQEYENVNIRVYQAK